MRSRRDDGQQVIIQVFPHGGWRIVLGSIGALVLIALALIFREALVYYLIGAITLSLSYGGFKLFEYIRNSNNDFRAAKAQTDQIVFQSRFFIQDTRAGAFYIEAGEDGAVTDKEYYAATISAQKAALLGPGEAEAPPQKPDLLRVMTQRGSAYAILGAQQGGKSWQAMHILDWWIVLGLRPTVIGYKAKFGEWAGCETIISDDPAELSAALDALRGEMDSRHRQIRQNQKPPLKIVVLDDWMKTRTLCGPTSTKFIADAGTVLASAGIIAYIIMQSDTAGAFGVKELGAMTKDNMTRLYLKPIRSAAGDIQSGQSEGLLYYPNDNVPVEVDLLAGRPDCAKGTVIEGELIEAEGSPEDKIRAALVDEPGLGIGKLQIIGWGSRGGSKHEERRDIIQRIRLEIAVS